MPSLSQSERILRAVLVEVARNHDGPGTLTYVQLGERAKKRGISGPYPMVDPPFRGLGDALGKISTYEHALGRPLISALVVKESTGQPGEGFVKLAASLDRDVSKGPAAFWKAEVAAVAEFWQDPDPNRATDAAFNRVLDILRLIRREM